MKEKLLLVFKINHSETNLLIDKIKKYKNDFSLSDIIIYYEELTSEDIKKINQIYKCKYIKETKLKKAKFEVFSYLKNYKMVVFSTANCEYEKKILDRYEEYAFSAIRFPNNKFVEANFKKLSKKFNMFETSTDTSLMIITDKLNNYDKLTKWCIKYSIINYLKLRNRIDGTLDIMIQNFNIEVTPIMCENKVKKNDNIKCPVQKKLNRKVTGELVSVVLPIYDRIDTIKSAIESILKQTYKNIEMIIVVEYTDKQKEINAIIESLNDKRIRIINNSKKLGLAESLNIGIKNSNGFFIARMDDDDISNYTRIEKQVNYLKENNDIAVVGTYMQFYGNSDLVCELPIDTETLKVKCLYKTPLFHPTVMFNLNNISKKDIIYNTDTYSEDYYMWSRLIEKYKIANIPEVLYYYNLSGNNSSTQNEYDMNDSHLDIMRYQLKKYLNLDLSFDELQLLSGRIDVLGNCKNLNKIYNIKRKLWLTIIKRNRKKKFYNENKMLDELNEVDNYYSLLFKLGKIN